MFSLETPALKTCFGSNNSKSPQEEVIANSLLLLEHIQTREKFVESAKELFEFILKDNIKGTVHKVYPLVETSRAHADLEGRLTAGKLLLKAESISACEVFLKRVIELDGCIKLNPFSVISTSLYYKISTNSLTLFTGNASSAFICSSLLKNMQSHNPSSG